MLYDDFLSFKKEIKEQLTNLVMLQYSLLFRLSSL